MSHANVIFTGGPVFTGTGQPQVGLAVVLSGDSIVALVPEAQAAAYRGPQTRVVELEGALLSPSFQDAHIHPMGGGLESLQCDLTESTDARDAVARVARYAEQHPDAAWIVGAGWSMEHFPGGAPSRQELDAATGDTPTLLASRDHHSAWANTAAITLAGLDASTPDPVDGRLEREVDGFPQGTFHEGAEQLFAAVRPEISEDDALAGLLAAQESLLRVGITGWQDAWVGQGMAGIENIDAVYRRAAAEGLLKVHVRGA